MRSQVLRRLLIVVTLAVPFLYNSCGQVVMKGSSGGSGAGNPMTNTYASKDILSSICLTLNRCHPDLTFESCEAGLLKTAGIGPQLGLARSFPVFSDLMNAERSGGISANISASISCTQTIKALTCDSDAVLRSYKPAAEKPFEEAAAMIPTSNESSCPQVFAVQPTRYVSKSGSDSNDGTFDSPWLTIQHAANQVKAGETVIVDDGIYMETVRLRTSGSITQPIVFKAKNNLGVKIAPPNDPNADTSYMIFVDQTNNVTIQGFEITGTDKTMYGLFLKEGSGNAAIGNYIHHIGNTSSSCLQTIGILNSGNDSIIYANHIGNIGSPPNVTYFCNQQHGISSFRGNGGLVQNNLIHQTYNGWALHFYMDNWSKWNVSNNTVIQAGRVYSGSPVGGALVVFCNSGICDDNSFNNNLFANISGACARVQNSGGTLGSNQVYSHNLLFNCNTSMFDSGGWTNSILSDPQFVNSTGDQNGDYRLRWGSPAIDAGTPFGAPSNDFLGQSRPEGTGIDIGAFEALH